MFCKNCGQEVDDNAVVCPHCGVQVGKIETPANNNTDGNTIAIVGFVFSFLIALVGLICSIMGYKNAKNNGAPYGGLALAGIIISVVEMALSLLLSIIIVAAAGSGV